MIEKRAVNVRHGAVAEVARGCWFYSVGSRRRCTDGDCTVQDVNELLQCRSGEVRCCSQEEEEEEQNGYIHQTRHGRLQARAIPCLPQ